MSTHDNRITSVAPNPAATFAICIENSKYPASLELHKLYPVLPDEDASLDEDLRIIDESGEDYLFPAEYFRLFEISRGRLDGSAALRGGREAIDPNQAAA